MKNRCKHLVLVMGFSGLLFLNGCGKNPLAPEAVPESASSPDIASVDNINFSSQCHGRSSRPGRKCRKAHAWLQVEIKYLQPTFLTAEGYPGYYINTPLTYEVHLKNTSCNTQHCLRVTAVQEYYESGTCNRWWLPDPSPITFTKGTALPGASRQVWKNVTLRPCQEVVLTATFTAPLETCTGLDQTHLLVQTPGRCGQQAATLYDDAEAGVFCPAPPME